jgi:hypothetical protein
MSTNITVELDQESAEAMLRAMHEHVSDGISISRLESIIHPEAEMRLLVSHGEL